MFSHANLYNQILNDQNLDFLVKSVTIVSVLLFSPFNVIILFLSKNTINFWTKKNKASCSCDPVISSAPSFYFFEEKKGVTI